MLSKTMCPAMLTWRTTSPKVEQFVECQELRLFVWEFTVACRASQPSEKKMMHLCAILSALAFSPGLAQRKLAALHLCVL